MTERPDIVLAVIPILAFSGLALRSMILATGMGTGLLALPLVVVGWVGALAVIGWELLFGPVPSRMATA